MPSDHTTCSRPADVPPSRTEPIAPAIVLSSVYKISDLDQIDALYEGRTPGYTYSRDGNPNSTQLAAKIAELEGAEVGLVCASGMGAESAALLGLLTSGDHIALSDGIYGKTLALVGREMSRFGVTHVFFDPTRPETLRDVLTPRTRVVFAETLSNPLLRVADIAGLAQVAKDAGATLIIDHTMAPLLCRPIALGAEAVTHSLTKLIGGHSDLLLGLVAGGRTLMDRATAVASAYGLNGNAFESWLALRGVMTLKLRSDRACDNAFDLAERLSGHRRVRAVHYPGLAKHPDHARASALFSGGFGTMVTFDLGGRAEVDAFIRRLKHVPFAPSFGDVATTLSHPATTSHRGQSPEQWARQGIGPGLVRLSVGLEDPADVWDDLARAFDVL